MENDAKDIIYRIQKANSLKKSFNTVYKLDNTVYIWLHHLIYAIIEDLVHLKSLLFLSSIIAIVFEFSVSIMLVPVNGAMLLKLKQMVNKWLPFCGIYIVVHVMHHVGVIAPEDVLESIKRDKFPYFLNIMKN